MRHNINLIEYLAPFVRAFLLIAICCLGLVQLEAIALAHGPAMPSQIVGDDDDDDDDHDDDDDIRFQTVSRLTISFPVDGTPISRYSNSLESSFANLMTREEIQETILSAFQSWTQHSAINVGLVSDSNDEFGIGGASQGDLRFGDVRVGAVPMAGDVYAVAVPSVDFVSGTWSGDLLFNSNVTFSDVDQFYAVALHEIGHILGLDHTDDVTSVMHPTALNTIFNADDIATLKLLHGERILLDPNDEADENNNTPDEAEEIENEDDINGIVPLVAFGDIENNADIDYFRFRPEDGQHGKQVTFRLISNTISLLQPKLTITDENGNFYGEETSDSTQGSDLSITVSSVVKDRRYFVRIESVGAPANQFGSYALVTTIDDNVEFGLELIDVAIRQNYGDLDQEYIQLLFLNGLEFPVQNDMHTNDSPATATWLPETINIALRSFYRIQASISDSTDVDFYQFEVPLEDEDIGPISAMSIHINSLKQPGQPGLISDVNVYGPNLQPLNGVVKVNGNGELLVDFVGIVPGETLFVAVSADQPGASFSTGNYDLNVAFSGGVRDLPELAIGRLDHENSEARHSLYVARTQLFHFALEGVNTTAVPAATIWMSIFDEDGELKYRVATKPNELRTSRSVMLRPGSYSVLVSVNVPVPLRRRERVWWIPIVNYRVLGIGISDPTGPETIDPSEDPFAPCDKNTSEFCYPNDRHSVSPFIFVIPNEVTPTETVSNPGWTNSNNWYWQDDWLG